MNDLVEDVLDAKDVIDNAVSHTYNSIRDKITELFGSTADQYLENRPLWRTNYLILRKAG
ncbi:Uncharacterised protein [Raoultella planticola]|uniref:Uncharacterized protein n=1 Tax=Raoultella planticola TaxID=575 RepID=A0A485D5P5_RAOPL|nr:Uncharacterised protein [Raoultella planticola]